FALDQILSAVGTMTRPSLPRRAVGPAQPFRFAFPFPDNLGRRARKSGRQFDLVECVAVAFEQDRLFAGEAEHVVTVGGLQDAHQRFGMKAVGGNRKLRNRSLQAVDPEHARFRERRDSVEGYPPERGVLGQFMKWAQQRRHVATGVFLGQRKLQFLDEIIEPDRVLLLVRVNTMRRLVQRQTWWLVIAQQQRSIIIFKCVHGRSPADDAPGTGTCRHRRRNHAAIGIRGFISSGSCPRTSLTWPGDTLSAITLKTASRIWFARWAS